MKFTVLHDFKAFMPFEAGNSHDSEKLGIPGADVERWYRNGFVQIDGKDPAPALDPKRTEIAVNPAKHKAKAGEVK